MNKKFVVSGSYFSLQDQKLTSIKFQIVPMFEIQTVQKNIVVVLDRSGSMYGKPIKTCKKTLFELFDYSQKELNNDQIDLLPFNSNCEIIDTFEKDLDFQKEAIQQIESRGGTRFQPIFKQLNKILEKRSNPDLCLVFLTDGRPEEDLEKVKKLAKNFQDIASKKLQTLDVHTLGYGSDHDARFCMALTESHLGQSSFQFIQNKNDIHKAIDSIAGSLGDKVLRGKFEAGEFTQNISFQVERKEDKSIYHKELIFEIDQQKALELAKSAKLIIYWEDEQLEFSISEFKEIEPQEEDKVRVNYIQYNNQLKQISDKLTYERPEKQQVEEYKKQYKEIRQKIHSQKDQIEQFSEEQRIEFQAEADDLSEYCNNLSDDMRDGFDQYDDEQYIESRKVNIAKMQTQFYKKNVRSQLSKNVRAKKKYSQKQIYELFN